MYFFRHVLGECVAVSSEREVEGITGYLASCREAGMSKAASHDAYVMGRGFHGRDCQGIQIPVLEHQARGGSLSRLTDAWLATWCEEEG